MLGGDGMLNEEEIMGIIMNAGDANRCVFEALDYVEENDYDQAKKSMKEAHANMLKAHKVQTSLIVEECKENAVPQQVSLMMVHAQDHLMNAVLLIDFVDKMISIFEKKDADRG